MPKNPTLAARKSISSISRFQFAGMVLGIVAIVVLGFLYSRGRAATTTFRFTAFSDTKTGTAAMAAESPQIFAMNPVFGLYPGDTCDSGPNAACFATWKNSINGNGANTLFDRMFVSRGNHDSSGATFWSSAFNFSALATRIGATNYSGDNFTYSFDYGNSHVAALDAPGGDSPTISATQVTWLDNDLKAAEARGITNSFAFWHGPIHPEGGHCCTDDPRFESMLGRHNSFKALFSGHEHNLGTTLIDSRYGNTGHPFYQVVTGGAGAGLYACQSGRADFCLSSYGFTMIDVNGGVVTLSLYKSGSNTPINTVTIGSNGSTPTPTSSPVPTPVPTPTPTRTPTPTPTPVPTPNPTPTRTPTPTPTPTPVLHLGDVNNDNKVNVFDLSIMLSSWGTNTAKADLNHDSTVNVFDLSILLAHWTG